MLVSIIAGGKLQNFKFSTDWLTVHAVIFEECKFRGNRGDFSLQHFHPHNFPLSGYIP